MFQSLFPSLLVIPLCLVGCVSQEGIYFENPAYGDKFLAKYGILPTTPVRPKTKAHTDEISWLVAIGRTTPLRTIQQDQVADLYQRYVKFFATWQADRDPFLSLEEFGQIVGGWSRVRVLSISGLWFDDRTAFVPKGLISDIEFANSVGSFLYGDGGDLVAAYSNGDGVYFIERVLCEQGPDYGDCRSRYQIGVFDAVTGQALDERMNAKKNGKDVDPVTLKKL